MNKPTHKAIHPESFRNQVAQKSQPHEPNFCDKREQSELVQTLPNRAKISEAKLVKEYVFANATNRTENKVRKHNNVYK